jgi:hypothetical protein
MDTSKFPKMKLPEGLFTNYKLAWGKFVDFNLENGPSCPDTAGFIISVDMETREILGNKDKEDNNERWFGERDVAIYDHYVASRKYDGIAYVSIYGNDTATWDVEFHGGFDDLAGGELPEGVTEDEVYEAIGKEADIYQLYEFVWYNKERSGFEDK